MEHLATSHIDHMIDRIAAARRTADGVRRLAAYEAILTALDAMPTDFAQGLADTLQTA